MNFDQLMENRYSCRSFSEEPLTEAELSELISAANGAPAVIFVSHRKQDLQPGIEWCNAMNAAMFIHLKATEMGLGSCFGWGVLESERMFPEYAHNDLLDLPLDFEPLIGIMVGHPAAEGRVRKIPENRLSINWI